MSKLFLGNHNIVNAPKREEKVRTELRGKTREPIRIFFPFESLYNKMVLENFDVLSRPFLLQSYLSTWIFLLPEVTNKYKIDILMKKYQ